MSLKNMIKIFPSSYILFHLMSVINIKNRIMTDYTRELKIAELIVRQEIGELDTAGTASTLPMAGRIGGACSALPEAFDETTDDFPCGRV